RIWHGLFLFSIIFGLTALSTLVLDVANDSFGLIVTRAEHDVDELTGGRALSELSEPELIAIIEEHASRRIRDRLNREQPLAERSRESLVEAVETEVLKTELLAVYPLFDALTRRDAIEADVTERFPGAEI